ncbi:MAG: ATP-binding protein [Helicobacteraceae bacterium]|jgi:SpoVK/Ycf46/Vps4 family AAA+-type ATPase|nr:ATP-binding protein [Helicobacteraceae bacterium]
MQKNDKTLELLLDFIEAQSAKQSAIFAQLKCTEAEAELLRLLTKAYLEGATEISVYNLLSDAYKKERAGCVTRINEVRTLIDLGWVTLGGFHHGRTSEIVSLELLRQSISLSTTFMKLIEDGSLDTPPQEVKPYDDHLEYLQEEFLRVDLYQKLALMRQNYDPSTSSFKRLRGRIAALENQIQARILASKEPPKLVKYFKDRRFDEKERIIFLALLKEEYGGNEDSLRDMNALIEIVSFDDYDKIKNRSLLEENAPLISKGAIDYEEVLTPFGGVSRSFYVADDALKEIIHPKKRRGRAIKLETLIKEQDIFELIDPKTTLDDVVLQVETKEALNNIVRQMDRLVVKRLKEWGIKDKSRGIDAKIIFYGAPGTGKTMTAFSIAKTLKRRAISFDCSKILSMYVGESEKNVRRIFDAYKEISAKTKTEPILLLNEADQFLSGRVAGAIGGAEKMHNQMQNIFLEQIERFNGILIAATNLLDNIDPAFSRRFDYKIKFEKPNESERLEIWKKLFPKNAPIAKNFNLKTLAKYQLTGAQIALTIKNAAMSVAVQKTPLFTNEIFDRAIKKELSGAFDDEKTLGFLS